MVLILFLTENFDSESGSGNDNTEIIEWFIKSGMRLAIYFILPVVEIIIIYCLLCIPSEESRLREDKRYRNRSNSDNQSWDDFVEEMESSMDVIPCYFVQSQKRLEIEENNNTKKFK